MSRTQDEAAFLGAVVVSCAYKVIEPRMRDYAFSGVNGTQLFDVWTGIGIATKFNRFRVFDDGLLAVATYVRQKHGTAEALRRCLEAFEACQAGTTVDQLADRLLTGESAA